jgi:tetratricopeptide (TPR) repeat protein
MAARGLSAVRFLRSVVRFASRFLFRLGARIITAIRLKPTSPLIVGIVRFMEASRAGRRLALAPAFSDFIAMRTARAACDAGQDGFSSDERGVLTVAAAAVAAKKPEHAINVLETYIAERRAHVLMFERLADVHLDAGSFERAEQVLQRGLAEHPSCGRLRLLLADASARLSKWDAAIRHWEQVPDDVLATASVWASIGLARAYRLNGNGKRADQVARRAAAVHPWNEQLKREIELCRPFYFQWSRGLVSAGEPPGAPSNVVGVVDSIGFLAGDNGALTGRVTACDEELPEVRFCVNGLTLVSTIAAETDAAKEKVFSINCAELLEYLGDGDVVRVVAGDGVLTLPDLGTAARVQVGLPSRLDVLEDMLRQGYVFTKFGRLRRGHTAASKRAMLDFYEEVSRLIESSTGLPVFPFYGTLLGAIRENDFIVHDVGGFDMVVVCEGMMPEEVRAEFSKVRQVLFDRGYHLKTNPCGVMIRRQQSDATFLDLSYGWFNAEDEFNVSFGWRYAPVCGRESFMADRTCGLADRKVTVPANAEEVLRQLYGAHWRVPDQGFADRQQLKRETSYLMLEGATRIQYESQSAKGER